MFLYKITTKFSFQLSINILLPSVTVRQGLTVLWMDLLFCELDRFFQIKIMSTVLYLSALKKIISNLTFASLHRIILSF